MQVLSIGPGLAVKGGVSAVERLIINSSDVIGVSITHLSSYEDGNIFVRLTAFIKCICGIPRVIFLNKVSIAHIHFSHYGSTLRKIILLHLLRIFRLPIIVHSHGSNFHEFFERLPNIGKKIVIYSLSQATCVIVLSESWRVFFINELHLCSSRVVVLKNPVEPIPSPIVRNEIGTRFLFLGRLEKRKGIYDILEALAVIHDRKLPGKINFVAAGDGDLKAIEKIITERKLASIVTLLGWVDRDRVVELLQSSDVLLLPSYNEGLPMALLEAMGCGVTIITSPVGGIPEIVKDGENGLLVEPGNVGELVEALIRSEDKGLRKRMGTNAKLSVQGYSLDAYCNALSSIYSSVYNQSRGINT